MSSCRDFHELLISEYGFGLNIVKKIVTGGRHTAVLLDNGNIGVCANLKNKVDPRKKIYEKIDTKNFRHRIVLSAYFNALLNYSIDAQSDGNIFEVINFKNYKKIIMVGYIKPVVERLNRESIYPVVFDSGKEDPILSPTEKLPEFLPTSDCVILSGTTLINNSFPGIIDLLDKNCDAYLLGPSSTMSETLFRCDNLKMIFGTVFQLYDERVLKIIADGGGTRDFLKYGDKKALKRK